MIKVLSVLAEKRRITIVAVFISMHKIFILQSFENELAARFGSGLRARAVRFPRFTTG